MLRITSTCSGNGISTGTLSQIQSIVGLTQDQIIIGRSGAIQSGDADRLLLLLHLHLGCSEIVSFFDPPLTQVA